MGKIFINNVPITGDNFTGIYFKDIPIILNAVPNQGYHFAGWQGAVQEKNNTISLILKKDATLQAIFSH
jgi:hypothetical protein